MTESFRIPIDIDHDLRKDAARSDLQNRVLQIINQKGHFRHVTERSLLAEDSDEDENENVQHPRQDEEEETSEKRDEKLLKAREDMFQQLERAQNDTLVALEMVSFLLSKHSIPASSTMSDELKKRVPASTLDSKVVQPREISEAKAKQFMLNSRGWRSTGFSSVSQNLASASVRMRNEAERESRYWEEVATLRASGVAVSRYPRESHAVAVHFGSANSSPQFRQRGIALLRQDADSNVYADQGPTANLGNRMQVDIYHGSRQTGSYAFNPGAFRDSTDTFQAILSARDALTIDELFHEVGREARIMANQGITTRGQTISFDVEDDYEVALTVKGASWEAKEALPDDSLAEQICLFLRTLLQQAHGNDSSRKTRTPPAMGAKPAQSPEYAILRPLVASLRHRAVVHELHAKVITKLLEPVRRAGLDIDWQDTSDFGKPDTEVDADRTSPPNKPCRSIFSCVLPSQRTLRLVVTSHLGSPVYGTQYELSGLDYVFTSVKQNVYHDLETALKATSELLTLDLAAFAASITTKSSEDSASPTGGWEVSRPHRGELTLRSTKSRKVVAGMKLDVVDAKMMLRISPAELEYQKGKKILAWAWSHGPASKRPLVIGHSGDIGIDQTVAERLSFREVVKKSLALAG